MNERKIIAPTAKRGQVHYYMIFNSFLNATNHTQSLEFILSDINWRDGRNNFSFGFSDV